MTTFAADRRRCAGRAFDRPRDALDATASRRALLGAAALSALGAWIFASPALARLKDPPWRRGAWTMRVRLPSSMSALALTVPTPMLLVDGAHRLETVTIAGNAERIDSGTLDAGSVAAGWAPGTLDPWLDIVWMVSVRGEAPARRPGAEPWASSASGCSVPPGQSRLSDWAMT